MTASVRTSRTAGETRDRLGAICAGAFGVLLIVGMTIGGLDTEQPDAGVLDDYEDVKGLLVVSMYALALAGFAFMVLASALIDRVRGGLSPRTELLARGTSVLFVGLLFVGGAAIGGVAAGDVFGPEDQGSPSVDLVKWLPQLGYAAVLLFGAWSAAIFVAIISWAGRAIAALPNWFTILGYVTSVLLLIAVIFIPFAMLAVWGIAAAVVLARRDGRNVGTHAEVT